MDQELISKKDLLELTGISYGQLYRWKRKSLIPEDWFIRKSTFTGQETFFPRGKMLERIDKIQSMKENVSLDELAAMFSPSVNEMHLSREDLIEKRVTSASVLEFFEEQMGTVRDDDFEQVLFIYILNHLLELGRIQLEEGKMILQVLRDHYKAVKQKNGVLIFVRKLGISSCLLVAGTDERYFEEGTKIVVELSIMSMVEELKSKLM